MNGVASHGVDLYGAVHPDRLWRRVDKSGGEEACWLWRGQKVTGGYGKISVVRHKHYISTHRLSFFLATGKLPPVVDHICRVPACVNPKHLRAATIRSNTLVGVAPTAVNARKTHCKNGHPFSEDNTYMHQYGWRRCRTCASARCEYFKARRLAKKEAAHV